jgi:hypothetical protein
LKDRSADTTEEIQAMELGPSLGRRGEAGTRNRTFRGFVSPLGPLWPDGTGLSRKMEKFIAAV